MTTDNNTSPPTFEQLRSCLKDLSDAAKNLHDSLFSQCCSNPIFNSWGKEIDVTAIAQLQDASNQAHKMLALHESEPS